MPKTPLLSILLITFLAGCSTNKILVVKPETLHFDSPETSGGLLNGSISFSTADKTPEYEFASIETTNFFGTNTTLGSNEKVKDASYTNFKFYLGIWDRIDFFTKTSGVTGVKVQLFGSSREQATMGWKLALSFATGDYSSVQSSNDLLILGAYDENAGLSTDGQSTDYGVNVGYRFNPMILSYANFFKNTTEVTGTYNNNTTTLSKHRSHNAKGINIGIEFISTDKFGFMSIEAGYIKSYWSTLGTDTFSPLGISFGTFW